MTLSTRASTVVTNLYVVLIQHSKHMYLSHRMQLQTYDSQNDKRLFTQTILIVWSTQKGVDLCHEKTHIFKHYSDKQSISLLTVLVLVDTCIRFCFLSAGYNSVFYGKFCHRPSKHRFSWLSFVLSQIPSCYCMLSIQPSRFRLIKICPRAVETA
jgi:hypothetical protein